MIHSFPVGPGQYLFGQEANLLSYETGEIIYKNQKIQGLIQLSILCPQNLTNPFLLIRNKNKRSIAPNCYICGYKSLPSSKINSCKHKPIERAIKGTYCISEINFALKLGYKILKIFSAFIYENSEPILRDFISLLGFEKLTSSKYDQSFDLDEIKNKMFFANDLIPQSFNENPEKRNFTKLALNSLLGKFSQRSDRLITKLVNSEEEVSKYFYSKTFNISEIFAVNKFFCHLQIKRKTKTLTVPNVRTNCIFGAQVVAFARQFMHEKMIELENLNSKIMYIDTDCLIFSLKKSQKMPFKISPCFGDFKFEIPEQYLITSFYCLGPKNFAIQFKNEKNELKDIVKLRGVTLKNEINSKLVDPQIYDFYLKHFLSNTTIKKSIPQVKNVISKHKNLKEQKFQKVFFSNSIKSKRIINRKSKNLDSFPFGFVKNQKTMSMD